MNPAKSTLLITPVGAVLCAALSACSVIDVYNVRGMEGWVVDKATKEPLAGVMVIEAWNIAGGGEGGTFDYLPLREATTDAAGRYEFTARGTVHVDKGYLAEDAPRLIFFKPGYVFRSWLNRYHPDRRFELTRRSDWHGKTIGLEKLGGSLEQYGKELERFGSALSGISGAGRRCLWMGIPKTLRLLRAEDLRMEEQGLDPKLGISAPWMEDELRKCPASDAFFQVYSK